MKNRESKEATDSNNLTNSREGTKSADTTTNLMKRIKSQNTENNSNIDPKKGR